MMFNAKLHVAMPGSSSGEGTRLRESSVLFQIKYVSAQDAGSYECQVSTVPKMSRRVELVVVVPKVRIN